MVKKIGFTLILFFSFLLNFYFYSSSEKQKVVTEVVDGDTFQLTSGKRVRLMGVNAPEYERCGGI